MKKYLIFILMAVSAFGADAANDLILSQRKSDNSGNIQRNVAPTTNGFLTFNSSKIPTSPDLTYSSPTLTFPASGVITGAGSLALTAGGSNQNITLTPSGTGLVQVGTTGIQFGSTTPGIVSGSAGALNITAAGTNQNIQISPSGAAHIGLNNTSANNVDLQFRQDSVNRVTFRLDPAGANFRMVARDSGGTTIDTPFRFALPAGGTFTIERPMAVTPTAFSVSAWGVTGSLRAFNSATVTDSSSSGTVATAVANSFAVPTFAASSATTFTNVANVYIGGDPTAGSNVTLTNSYGLWNVGKTRLDGSTTFNGSANFVGTRISIDTTAESVGNLGNVGTMLNLRARNITDTSGSGTVAVNSTFSVDIPTLLASSPVTYTDATMAFFNGPPVASTNVTITRKHSILVQDGTSAGSSITGAVVISSTIGTAATSTAIGAGNINTGGTLTTGGNVTIGGTVASYNGLATAGNGVATIQGSGRVTAQTAAAASVMSYTVGASDASFLVSGNVNVTTSTTHSFTMTVAYTDETNAARTLTMSFQQLAGTIINTITNVTGAGPYEGVPAHIRCKAGTTVTVATTGTFTTVTYNAEANLTKLQ